MSIANGFGNKRGRRLVAEHRLEKYLDAINRLIDGKSDPEYVAMRAKKLKEIKYKPVRR